MLLRRYKEERQRMMQEETPAPSPELSKMTKAQLLDFAEANGLEIEDGKKAEILEQILAQLDAREDDEPTDGEGQEDASGGEELSESGEDDEPTDGEGQAQTTEL